MQRNAILALAHFKEASAIPDLIGVMKDDPRPVLAEQQRGRLGKLVETAWAKLLKSDAT